MEPTQIFVSHRKKSCGRENKREKCNESLLMYVMTDGAHDPDLTPEDQLIKDRCRPLCKTFVQKHKFKEVVMDYNDARFMSLEFVATLPLPVFLKKLEMESPCPWASLVYHVFQWAKFHAEELKESAYAEFMDLMKDVERTVIRLASQARIDEYISDESSDEDELPEIDSVTDMPVPFQDVNIIVTNYDVDAIDDAEVSQETSKKSQKNKCRETQDLVKTEKKKVPILKLKRELPEKLTSPRAPPKVRVSPRRVSAKRPSPPPSKPAPPSSEPAPPSSEPAPPSRLPPPPPLEPSQPLPPRSPPISMPEPELPSLRGKSKPADIFRPVIAKPDPPCGAPWNDDDYDFEVITPSMQTAIPLVPDPKRAHPPPAPHLPLKPRSPEGNTTTIRRPWGAGPFQKKQYQSPFDENGGYNYENGVNVGPGNGSYMSGVFNAGKSSDSGLHIPWGAGGGTRPTLGGKLDSEWDLYSKSLQSGYEGSSMRGGTASNGERSHGGAMRCGFGGARYNPDGSLMWEPYEEERKRQEQARWNNSTALAPMEYIKSLELNGGESSTKSEMNTNPDRRWSTGKRNSENNLRSDGLENKNLETVDSETKDGIWYRPDVGKPQWSALPGRGPIQGPLDDLTRVLSPWQPPQGLVVDDLNHPVCEPIGDMTSPQSPQKHQPGEGSKSQQVAKAVILENVSLPGNGRSVQTSGLVSGRAHDKGDESPGSSKGKTSDDSPKGMRHGKLVPVLPVRQFQLHRKVDSVVDENISVAKMIKIPFVKTKIATLVNDKLIPQAMSEISSSSFQSSISRRNGMFDMHQFSSDLLIAKIYEVFLGDMDDGRKRLNKNGLADNPGAFLAALRQYKEPIGLSKDSELAQIVLKGDESSLQTVLSIFHQVLQSQTARHLKIAMEFSKSKNDTPQKPFGVSGGDIKTVFSVPALSVVDMAIPQTPNTPSKSPSMLNSRFKQARRLVNSPARLSGRDSGRNPTRASW